MLFLTPPPSCWSILLFASLTVYGILTEMDLLLLCDRSFPIWEGFSLFDRNLPFSVCLSLPCWLLLASPYLLQGSKEAELFQKEKKKSLYREKGGPVPKTHRFEARDNSFLIDEKASCRLFQSIMWVLAIREDELSRSVWSGGKFEKSCGNKMERTAESGLRRRRRRLAALETSAILSCYSLRRVQQKQR